MKVLLRKYCNNYYVWKDAVYKEGCFVFTGDNVSEAKIKPASVIAVKDDDRSKYVVCSNCGKMIKNDPESIEAHFNAVEAKKDCIRCTHLTKRNVQTVNIDAVETDNNGNFTIKQTYTADLFCGLAYWNKPKINSEGAKSICRFFECRRRGVKEIEDTFTKYPGLFDKYIAVDALIANGFLCDGYTQDCFEYDMRLRNTLKACVNELGIVDHFVLTYRSRRCRVYYSAKYDKLFFECAGDYEEECPFDIAVTKYNAVKAKISALYKEEKGK